MSNRGRSVNHDKYNLKCVCAICTCGSHRCPQKPHAKLRLDSETTNQALQSRWKERPAPITSHYDPELLQTSYKNTYKGLPLLSQIGKTTRDQSKPIDRKKVPFEGSSTYKSQFLSNDIQPVQRKRFQYHPNLQKFNGESEYKQHFQKQHNRTLNAEFQSKNNIVDSFSFQNRKKVPFQGQSSYKSQYKIHDAPAPKRRQYKYEPNTAKFQGESTYKSFYPKHNIVQQICPILQLPKAPREPSVGKNHLNFVSEKNAWQ